MIIHRAEQKGVALAAGVWTVVLGPVDLLQYPNKTLTIRNTGANPITNGEVQATAASLTAPDAEWEVLDATNFANLVAGAVKSYQITGGSRQFLRVRLQSVLGSTVDGYITATGA